jgi:cellulose synthase/poly-beta-1,6-N-acetylglucosamine synthase-like glycosyltransferase
MTEGMPHISVCICTYKRPEYLRRLLEALKSQDTCGMFTYSIVVADNDYAQSAASLVRGFANAPGVAVKYCVEPRQNIALARDKAISNASGDFVAFVDDDEFPLRDWLLTLFNAIRQYQVDGVLGPVKPHFEADPPQWIIRGGFHDRPMHTTGSILDWSHCRTGNVLLRSQLFAKEAQPFRPECLSGEDQDFFRRMIGKGYAFVWCNEAVVYEVVPPSRWKRGFLIRRALFRGMFSLRNHGFSTPRVLQSLIATPAYLAALPIALILGDATFMRCVFKLSYHVGRLLALVGINPIRGTYVTE